MYEINLGCKVHVRAVAVGRIRMPLLTHAGPEPTLFMDIVAYSNPDLHIASVLGKIENNKRHNSAEHVNDLLRLASTQSTYDTRARIVNVVRDLPGVTVTED